MKDEWITVHYEALMTVDRDIGIKYFKRCKIPGSYSMLTINEYNKLVTQMINPNPVYK